MSKGTKFIVGCDIRAYSKLPEKKKKSLTSHLYASHISSCGQVMLEHDGFNDTGDGFFVTFPYSADNQDAYKKYISHLQETYFNPAIDDLKALVAYHWLRIAAGVGNVSFIVEKMNFMRSTEIDLISRLLDASKLPVPLLKSGADQLLHSTDIEIRDKHGNVLACSPMYLDDNKNGEWTVKSLTRKPRVQYPGDARARASFIKNPFYLLKKQCLPMLFHDIDSFTWHKFNEYIYFNDVIINISRTEGEDNDRYLIPYLFYGHTLKDVTKTLSALAGYYEINKKVPPSGSIKLLFVDPDSVDAKSYAIDERIGNAGDSPVCIYEKLIQSLNDLNALVAKNPLLNDIEIYFSDKLITKGIHKVLDYMVIIHYGDDHKRTTAGYELFNFFGTADEREHFIENINNYFAKLINNELSRVSVSRAYKPADIKYLTAAIKFEEFVESINDKFQTLNCSTIQYKKYMKQGLKDFILNDSIARLNLKYPDFRQIELHPSDACNYSCQFCQGAQSRALGTIPVPVYKKFIESTPTASIEKVIISGEYSEPLIYPYLKELIKEISGVGLPIGLYSNGTIRFDNLLDNLMPGLRNYVVVNLPSATKSLTKITGRQLKDYANIMDSVEHNFKLLSQLYKDKLLYRINVNYEISDDNVNYDVIEDTIKFLQNFDVDLSLKITIPVMPLKYFGDSNQIERVKTRIERALSCIDDLALESYGKVKIQCSLNTYVRNRFSKCYAILDSLVVRSDGAVVPCCYTANEKYNALSYANIGQHTFSEVVELRNNKYILIGKRKPKHICPPCSKKDCEINEIGVHNI